jgi:hypothetical protein
MNPDYSSYIAFRADRQFGVAVLTNANSAVTPSIANAVMSIIAGEEIDNTEPSANDGDVVYRAVDLRDCIHDSRTGFYHYCCRTDCNGIEIHSSNFSGPHTTCIGRCNSISI